MQAVRFAEYGGPEVLQLADVPVPEVRPGQVRVIVRAAGVNRVDWKIRQGSVPERVPRQLPKGTGTDAAGVVDEVGQGVSDVQVGDAVFGSGVDTYAEQAVLTSWAHIPEVVAFTEAAGYPVPVETAIRILDAVAAQPGQTLLINGAAGGVGSATVQIARNRGVTVIGTAGFVNQRYLGGRAAMPTTAGVGLVDRVREPAPDGVAKALDIAGSGVIPELVELTGEPSAVLSIADSSAPEHGARVSVDPGSDHSAVLREGARL